MEPKLQPKSDLLISISIATHVHKWHDHAHFRFAAEIASLPDSPSLRGGHLINVGSLKREIPDFLVPVLQYLQSTSTVTCAMRNSHWNFPFKDLSLKIFFENVSSQ